MALLFVGLIVLGLITVGCALWLSSRISDVEHQLRLGPAKILIENVAKLRIGMTQANVTRLLGPPDDSDESEWTYFYSDHAGYRILFDSNKRLESIRESVG